MALPFVDKAKQIALICRHHCNKNCIQSRDQVFPIMAVARSLDFHDIAFRIRPGWSRYNLGFKGKVYAPHLWIELEGLEPPLSIIDISSPVDWMFDMAEENNIQYTDAEAMKFLLETKGHGGKYIHPGKLGFSNILVCGDQLTFPPHSEPREYWLKVTGDLPREYIMLKWMLECWCKSQQTYVDQMIMKDDFYRFTFLDIMDDIKQLKSSAGVIQETRFGVF